MMIYTLRRLIGALSTLFLLATLTFFFIRMAPGGPFDQSQTWPPEIYTEILKQYDLDQPLPTQYLHWLQSFFRASSQNSLHYLDTPISQLILTALPISLFLGLLAIGLSLPVGLALGCLSTLSLPASLHYLIEIFVISTLTLPSYIFAGLLVVLFSIHLHWLPAALWHGPSSWILPTLTLAWRPIGLIAQVTRLSVQEEFTQNYIRTALGKGVSPWILFFKHILKNSALPILGSLGPTLAHLIAGSFLVETLFQIPGMGRHLVQAVLHRDYPLVVGTTLTYGSLLLLCQLCTDLIALQLDPRLKEDL
jgi:oligopeptide transport system permease protein